jgi:YVTN family beta-propeller protein
MIYVVNEGSNSVSVIDSITNTVSSTISVGLVPNGISVSPEGNKVYVVNYVQGTVSVINTSTNTVVDTIIVGVNPYSIGNFISTATVGIPSITAPTPSISIYPNPTNSILNIKTLPFQLNSQLIITDIMGNEVYHETLTGIDNSIAITTWSAGLYFYEIRSNNEVARGKFVKE